MTRGEGDLFSCYSSKRIGDRSDRRKETWRLEDASQLCRSSRCIRSDGDDGVGQEMRLSALPQAADGRWLTSLKILRLTGEDFRVGGNWAGQSGGSG